MIGEQQTKCYNVDLDTRASSWRFDATMVKDQWREVGGRGGESKEVGCVAMLITGRIERESECPRTAIERV